MKQTKITAVEQLGSFNEMPVLKLVAADGTISGYIAPFRGYKFQISDTQDGDGDCGGSKVVGLGNIVLAGRLLNANTNLKVGPSSLYATNIPSFTKGMFRALISQAFENSGIDFKYGPELEEALNEFVERCISYVESRMR